MRKILIGILATTIVATGLGSSALAQRQPQPKTRTVAEDYECPCGVSAANGSFGVSLWDHNAATFPTQQHDRYVQVSIDDDIAQTVHARIAQDTEPGDLEYELWVHICGATTEPLKITPGVDVHIDLLTGTCQDQQTPSFPTRGVITATFGNMP